MEELVDLALLAMPTAMPLVAGRRKQNSDGEWDDPDALAEEEFDDIDETDDDVVEDDIVEDDDIEEEDLDDFTDDDDTASLDELEEEEDVDDREEWDS